MRLTLAAIVQIQLTNNTKSGISEKIPNTGRWEAQSDLELLLRQAKGKRTDVMDLRVSNQGAAESTQYLKCILRGFFGKNPGILFLPFLYQR